MKRWTLLAGLLGAVLGADTVVVLRASASASPYAGIPARNIFALRIPPPSVPLTEPAPPAAKLRLNGITTILGGKLALLKCTLPPASGSPAKEEFYILGEGERAGTVAVLSIDEKAGLVRVDNSGSIVNLSFNE
jgi:hypothetical protein